MSAQTMDYNQFAVDAAKAALAAFATKQAPTVTSYLPDFLQLATRVIEMGGYVVPVDLPGTQIGDRVLNGKQCVISGWQQKATRDPAQVEAWYKEKPHRNCAIVGKAEVGALWGFDDDEGVIAEYENEYGLIPTYRIRTVSGHTTLVFKHNAESIALDNLTLKNGNGEELFSCRTNNRYIMSAGSIAHPDNDLSKPVVACIALDKQTPIEASSHFLQVMKQKAGKVESKSVNLKPVAAPERGDDQPFQSNAPEWVRNLKAKDGDFDAVLAVTPTVLEGGRNSTLASVLGHLHQGKWSDENVREVADRINQKFQPTLSDTEVKTTVTSICKYPVKLVGSETVHMSQTDADKKVKAEKDALLIAAIRAANPKADTAAVNRIVTLVMRADKWTEKPREEKAPSETMVNIPSSAFTSSRLSDIYADVFAPNDWPLTLALPALVTAASVIVPQMPRGEGELIVGDDPLCTLYTALIADVHAGKTQITNWATRAIGIMPKDETLGQFYYAGKWGSGEQLLRALQKKQESFTNKSALICPDEWSHLFSKAAIPNASFPATLTTAFYKKHHNFTLGGENGGREYNLNLAMSFIGGIVESEFDTVFGAGSLGGLYDRFLFGHAPEDFHWQYRPCPIVSASQWSTWGVKSVHLDESVFEETRTWDKNGQMGRIVEVCVRIATIFASVDGRQKITGKDLEPLLPLARYQMGLRAKFSPNAGESPEAIFANKAVGWVNKNALVWKSITDLKQALWRLEERLGPNVAERSLASVARGGKIDLWMAFNNTDKATGEISYPPDYDGPKVRTGLVRRVF